MQPARAWASGSPLRRRHGESVFDLPEPLKSSLMRSSMEKSIGFVVGRLGQGQGLAR